MQRAASGIEVADDQDMPLSAVLQLGLHAHVDVVEQIVEAAMKENKMEAALERMSRFWDTLEFKVEKHRGTDQLIMYVLLLSLSTAVRHHFVHAARLCACMYVCRRVRDVCTPSTRSELREVAACTDCLSASGVCVNKISTRSRMTKSQFKGC